MRLTIDGAAVHMIGRANGDPTLVFLHGAGMHQAVWRDTAVALDGAGYATLRLDWPGHGGSEGTALPEIPKLATWLEAGLDALEIERPVLIGHSMGAAAAGRAAATMAERVAGLVLCATAEKLAVHPDLLRLADEDRAQAESLIAKWGVGPRAADNNGDINFAEYFTPQADGVLTTDLESCNRYDKALEDARSWQCPVLLVTGSDDKMTPPAKAKPLMDAARNALHVEIKGAGHMMPLETPKDLASAIEAFVKERL